MNELPEEAPKESKSLAESSEAQRTGQTEAELNMNASAQQRQKTEEAIAEIRTFPQRNPDESGLPDSTEMVRADRDYGHTCDNLAQMAIDFDVQREIAAINAEFAVMEMDGLT
jgi:hypothetical protein